MSSLKPQLILFDCDGTLVDSHGHITHVMQQTFEACSLPAPAAADVHMVIGLSLHEAVRVLLPSGDVPQHEMVVAAYRRRYGAVPDVSLLYAGVRDTLEKLVESGYWLGIVTGKSHRGLMRTLDEHDLHAVFQVWRTADVCPSKPHPAMVLECMQEMGVDAAQTSVVGDSCFDIEMATASGVRALGVSFGVGTVESLQQAGASDVVHSFEDLLVHFPPLQGGELPCTMNPG